MSKQLFDAQAALGFVVSQTSHIEQAVNQVTYPDIQYPGIVPVDTSAHPFAKSVTYYSSDKAGAARWINGGADDVPNASTELTKFETAVYTAAIGYSYSWEEINQAQLLGMPLTADYAMAARRAAEEFIDNIAMNGDTDKNMEGLLNSSTVPQAAATNGAWDASGTTGDDMIDDVNEALQLVHVTNTNTAVMADTILLPWGKLHTLSTTRLGNTNISAAEYLARNNIYTLMTGAPLTIRGLRLLDTAGISGGARMVAYRRSPEVVVMHVPMPHRFLPVYQSGPLTFEVPGVFRLGGVDWRRPQEATYVDGL